MKSFLNIITLTLLCLFTLQVSHAELIDNSSIRYKVTPEESLIFLVTKEHAVKVIEPQMSFNWTLDQHKDKAVVERLTPYVMEHNQYQLAHWMGLKPEQIKIDKIYIGYPNNLPEGLMFVSDVRIKQGFFWKKVRVGFIIPAVKGFTAKEIVYFIYPEKDQHVKKTNKTFGGVGAV